VIKIRSLQRLTGWDWSGSGLRASGHKPEELVHVGSKNMLNVKQVQFGDWGQGNLAFNLLGGV